MKIISPKPFYFQDNGGIPNSILPLLVYRSVTSRSGPDAAEWFQTVFTRNGWMNAWRWGIYPYHHFHSNTHEVLGVFSGEAMLVLGGPDGLQLKVETGDVLVIPAGVGHRCISFSPEFCVLGAYAGGGKPDMNTGMPGERPGVDHRIAAVPLPDADPLGVIEGGLLALWRPILENGL